MVDTKIGLPCPEILPAELLTQVFWAPASKTTTLEPTRVSDWLIGASCTTRSNNYHIFHAAGGRHYKRWEFSDGLCQRDTLFLQDADMSWSNPRNLDRQNWQFIKIFTMFAFLL